jgi:hypothetical protein
VEAPVSQLTLYLDAETEALLNTAAASSGLSRSRWVSDVIRRYAVSAWPAECPSLAGTFPDFPLAEELRCDATPAPPDVPRIGF